MVGLTGGTFNPMSGGGVRQCYFPFTHLFYKKNKKLRGANLIAPLIHFHRHLYTIFHLPSSL